MRSLNYHELEFVVGGSADISGISNTTVAVSDIVLAALVCGTMSLIPIVTCCILASGISFVIFKIYKQCKDNKQEVISLL